MNEPVVASSGNIFLDLGFPPDEAGVLSMRADLMAQQRTMIHTRALTQEETARLLGVHQSRVSDLVRGKWQKFSLDMLVTLALRAGMRVEMNLAA